jgi:hypothetical protein
VSGLIQGIAFFLLGTASLYCGLWAYLIWRMPPGEWERLIQPRPCVYVRNGEWADRTEGGAEDG